MLRRVGRTSGGDKRRHVLWLWVCGCLGAGHILLLIWPAPDSMTFQAIPTFWPGCHIFWRL